MVKSKKGEKENEERTEEFLILSGTSSIYTAGAGYFETKFMK